MQRYVWNTRTGKRRLRTWIGYFLASLFTADLRPFGWDDIFFLCHRIERRGHRFGIGAVIHNTKCSDSGYFGGDIGNIEFGDT